MNLFEYESHTSLHLTLVEVRSGDYRGRHIPMRVAMATDLALIEAA